MPPALTTAPAPVPLAPAGRLGAPVPPLPEEEEDEEEGGGAVRIGFIRPRSALPRPISVHAAADCARRPTACSRARAPVPVPPPFPAASRPALGPPPLPPTATPSPATCLTKSHAFPVSFSWSLWVNNIHAFIRRFGCSELEESQLYRLND